MKEAFTYRAYTVRTCYPREKAERLLDSIIDQHLSWRERVKDDRRNFIGRTSFEGDDLVVKIPRARNQRWYQRIRTWWQPGEAARRYESMRRLTLLGLTGTPALLMAEKRRAGMVVDSFFAYRYVDGRLARPGDERVLCDVLDRLHHKGFVRRDCKPSNFVIVEGSGEACFIDFRLTRPRGWRAFRIDMERCQFLMNMPTAWPWMKPERTRHWRFRLARRCQLAAYKVNKWRRAWSRRFRRRAGEQTQ